MSVEKLYCKECGGEILPDSSPGVFIHADTDECDGHDIDAEHVAIPDLD